MDDLRTIVVFFSLILLTACGGSDSKSEPSPVLKASNDQVTQTWSEQVTIDVLANDDYPAGTQLAIIDDAESGNASVDGMMLVFNPPESEVSTDVTYRLTAPDGRTSQATVNINLVNKIIVAKFDEELLPAIETQVLPLHVETLLPVTSGRLQISVRQDSETDAEVTSKVVEVPNTQQKFVIDYQVTEDLLNYFGIELEQTLELSLDENSTLDNLDYTFSLINTPPGDYLRKSFRGIWFSDSGASAIVDRGQFFLSWTSFAPWEIPEEPTWRENPYDNRTWLLYYHSLAWLYAYDYRFEQTGDERYLEAATSIINDYISNVTPDTYFKMMWDDHTIASRADTIAYFYQKFVRNKQPAAVKKLWLEYLEVHAARLDELLRDSHFDAHNHGLIHATALYSLTFAIPELSDRLVLRQNALDRMDELFGSMVNVETGLSIEQSTNYQLVAMEMFSGATRLIRRMDGTAPAKLSGYLTTMANLTVHWIYQNGGAPAIGDSNYRATNYLSRLSSIVEASSIESDYLRFIQSDGAEGTPLKQQYVSADEGYVFSRPDYAFDETETYLFSEFGEYYFSHGHHDATNVVFAVGGKSILVDSGGPYLYNSERRYFQSAHGHNVLVVDDALSFKNDAEFLGATCTQSICLSYGRVNEPTHTNFRLNVVAKEPVPRLYVFDIAESTTATAEDHLYELNWHFPPKSNVTMPSLSNECLAVTTPWDTTWCMFVESSESLAMNSFEGFDENGIERGWVQPKFGTRQPAPQIIYSATGESFLSLMSLLPSEADAQLKAFYEQTGDTIQIDIGTHTIDITSWKSEAPLVGVVQH